MKGGRATALPAYFNLAPQPDIYIAEDSRCVEAATVRMGGQPYCGAEKSDLDSPKSETMKAGDRESGNM